MALLTGTSRVPAGRHSMPGPRELIAAPAGPDLLLGALALMIWTYVWRIQDLFPVLGALQINLLSTALAVGLFLLDRDPVRRIGRIRSPILFCALAMSLLAALGIPTSLWPSNSATFLLTGFLPNLALMVLLAASVRGTRDLRWIVLASVLGAIVHSLYVFLTFGVGSDGRMNDLIYYDANDLALVLVCTIAFTIFLFVSGGWRVRLLAVAAAVLLMVTLVKTGSRGGFVGLVAVLLYVLLRYRAIPRRIRFLVVVGGAGMLSLVASDAYWASIRTLGDPRQDYNWSGRATSGRMEVWSRGLGYLAAHPVLGVGLRNFPTAEGTLSEESRTRAERGAGFKWSAAHNSFLEVGVELGVIALALFIGMIVAALHALGRIRSAPLMGDAATLRDVALACTLSASLVGFIVSGFLVSAAYFSLLYVLLGLTMGFTKVHRLDQLRGAARPSDWERLMLLAHRRRPIGERVPLARRTRGAPALDSSKRG